MPRQDGAVLHFVKELPAWIILGLFTGTFLAVWQVSHDDFIPRIIDGLIGALLLSIQRAKTVPQTNIKTDTVETDAVNTDSITDSTFNTKNVQNKKEKL